MDKTHGHLHKSPDVEERETMHRSEYDRGEIDENGQPRFAGNPFGGGGGSGCAHWHRPGGVATGAGDDGARALTAAERKGLRNAGWAVLFVIGLWTFFTIGPGTPLIDESASAEAQMAPFYKSLVAAFFVLFLLSGWAYGKGAGTVENHRDLVKMMTGAMEDLAYYLVLAFVAAHFVAQFRR